MLGSRTILATEDAKRAAWRETGALAVDMESAVVARAADAAGIPFLVLRAIADPAVRELPSAALIPLAENGTPALARVLVFTRTKHTANRVAEQLARAGFSAEAIHGNKSQGARQRAL